MRNRKERTSNDAPPSRLEACARYAARDMPLLAPNRRTTKHMREGDELVGELLFYNEMRICAGFGANALDRAYQLMGIYDISPI